MKKNLWLILMLVPILALAQQNPYRHQFFTTNLNPIVETVAGTNGIQVLYSTVGANLRRYTVSYTNTSGGSATTNADDLVIGTLSRPVNTTGSVSAVRLSAIDSLSNLIVGAVGPGGGSSGTQNVVVSIEGFANNTIGRNNTGIGGTVLQNNTSGDYNTGAGHGALANVTSGSFNTATGGDSMYYHVSGDNNSAYGVDSMFRSIACTLNTAIGQNAMVWNTNGTANTTLGMSSFGNFVGGTHNVALGYGAHYGPVDHLGLASYNTIVGSTAFYVGQGNDNSVLGYEGGNLLTNSWNNVFLGSKAGGTAGQQDNLTNSIAIGSGTFTEQNNEVVLGNSAITKTTLRGIVNGITLTNNGMYVPNGITALGDINVGYEVNVAGVAADPSAAPQTGHTLSLIHNGAFELAQGFSSSSPYNAWLQSRHATIAGIPYALSLNPLGGNVGINTTNATKALTVAGNANITGTLTATNADFYGTTTNDVIQADTLEVAGDATFDASVTAGGTVTATNGLVIPFKSSFSTNYTCTTNVQIYMMNGTNQVITLPNAAHVPGVVYRFASTNGRGNFTITNATGAQTIRDGVSLSFKQVGIGSPSYVSDGAHWWPAARTKMIMPNAQFSLSTNVTVGTTAIPVPWQATDFNNSQGIALGVGSNGWHTSIWITNQGQYEFSPSVIETFDGNNSITFWFKAGSSTTTLTNIPASATSCRAQNLSIRVITVPFLVDNPGPTCYEIWAICDDAAGNGFVAQAAGGAAPNDYPSSPAIICPVKKVSDHFP